MVRNQAYGCIEQVVFFLGAVLLEILYGSVPPGSPNSEPILGEKNEHVPFHIGFQSWPRKSTLVFRPGLKDLCIVCQPNGELKQRRRRRQRERQKSSRVLSPKQQLCTSHAFLYISLPSLHDYAVKLANFTFRGGRERRRTIFFFFF